MIKNILKEYTVEIIVWIVSCSVLLHMICVMVWIRDSINYVDYCYEVEGWSTETEVIRIGNARVMYSRYHENVSHTDEAKAKGAVDNGFYTWFEE